MLLRLRHFEAALKSGETQQTLRDRRRFTRHEKTRTAAMHRIEKNNKALERLLRGSVDMDSWQSRPLRSKTPPTRTRRFSEALYSKMARKWPRTCSCPFRHEARLCLWNCCSKEDHDESDDTLDIVVSVAEGEGRRPSWQESTILVSER
jgi:hypothetical protein